jgi:hypothetical protein
MVYQNTQDFRHLFKNKYENYKLIMRKQVKGTMALCGTWV